MIWLLYNGPTFTKTLGSEYFPRYGCVTLITTIFSGLILCSDSVGTRVKPLTICMLARWLEFKRQGVFKPTVGGESSLKSTILTWCPW
jgi:hypothetical protein